MTIALDYPHDTYSHQPLALSARDIWRLGEEARAQVDGGAVPALNFLELTAKSRRLRINGLELETCWAFQPVVRDDDGAPVLAAIEYDKEVHRTALMCLNSTALAGLEPLTMSTAAHELGHAIFDASGWIITAEKLPRHAVATEQRFRSVVRRYRSHKSIDPAEFPLWATGWAGVGPRVDPGWAKGGTGWEEVGCVSKRRSLYGMYAPRDGMLCWR